MRRRGHVLDMHVGDVAIVVREVRRAEDQQFGPLLGGAIEEERCRAGGNASLREHQGGKGKDHRIQLRDRSEEHTSELQSLMRISYAVFCLKKKKKTQTQRQK